MAKANEQIKEEQPQEGQEQKQPQEGQEQKQPQEERVEITIPRALDGEERSLFVSVNGVNYLLPKGKVSKVPLEVAQEIRRSWAAQNDWDDRAETMAGTGEPPAAQ